MKQKILSIGLGKVLVVFGLLLAVSAALLGYSRLSVNHSSNEEAELNVPRTENEFEEDAEKREDWFIQQRQYPFDKIPDDARRRAFESRPAESDAPDAATWNAVGPLPTTSAFPNNWGITSGRINAVTVSPANSNIVLVGGATGGIWRSTNGGTSFAPVTDTQVDLAVGSITFAPSNANIVYAGMGDKASQYLGTGVLKSIDAGATWTRVSNATLPSPGQSSKIEVDATDPNRVYLALYTLRSNGTIFAGGFYYSTDGGVNWTRTLSGTARDLVRDPTNAQVLYVAMQSVFTAGFSAGVLKSTDKGLTWTQSYNAASGNIKLAISASNPQVLYTLSNSGATPQLARSADGGATWTNLGSATFNVAGSNQSGYNLYVFVNPTNPNIVYVGMKDVFRSTNGGASFTNLTNNFTLANAYTPNSSKAHPDQHHFYISPADPNQMFVANDGGIWKSNDGGGTFQSMNASLGLTMFTSIAIHPTNASIIYGGTQDNGTQRRTGALTWKEFSGGDGGQTVIDALDPTIIYSTYVNGSVTRWLNNSNTYDGQIGSDDIFNNDRVAFYPPFVGNSVNSNLYFGTYRLYISTDRGDNWNEPGGATDLTNGGVLSAIGVGRANINTIYTGSNDGRVMVSTDGGINWTQRTTNLPNRFIKSIIVSPTNSNVAYLTVSGFGSGHVFKTTNAGVSWTDISSNLPDIPVNTLLVDPLNAATLYIGTDIGIYTSTNDGGAWAGLNAGLPPTIVNELDAQPTGQIVAATYGRGAYSLNRNVAPAATRFDYDGDGKADISVFRPSNGAWYLSQSQNGFTGVTFGISTDKIVPADYDGDGKTDVAVVRNGTWYLQRSQLGFTGVSFGAADDIPVPGDYDGDGKADIAVFRPSTGAWYIQQSTAGFIGVSFGQNGDRPVAADYDGDGKTDIAINRAGVWYLQRSQLGFTGVTFGDANDKTVPADYDGDGKADIAVFRPSTGVWYIQQSSAGFTGISFGTNGDQPSAADYDGDGKADIGVFRSGAWYLQRSTQGFTGISFGTTGDLPTPNAFVR